MAERTETAGGRDSFAAYAALVRVPNLFTAPPDVVLGAALAAVAGYAVAPVSILGLAVASAFLYAAGTTLNDYFDAPRDAKQRPERPIPSGAVSRRAALGLGAALLAAGVVSGFVAAGAAGATIAALLALAIVLYDGPLKGGPVGFVAMGTTRTLNVALGVTAAAIAPTALPPALLAVPVVVGAYIAAVTAMAAGETVGDNRETVGIAAVGTVIAGVVPVALLTVVRPPLLDAVLALLLAGAFLAWTGSALRRAYADPVPETVGPAVGQCVLGLVILDAAFAAVAGIGWGLVALSFLVPAVGLSRAFDVT